MWRSFFSAVGIFLIILGVQTLVVDQFLITTNRTSPKFLLGNKVNDVVAPNNWNTASNYLPQSNANSFAPRQQFSMPTYGSNNVVPGVGQSAYGPSRYQNQYSVNSFNSQRPSYSQAGFPSARSLTVPDLGGPTIQVSPRPFYRDRLVQTRDWMPWSLLAAGTLILLAGRRGRGMGE